MTAPSKMNPDELRLAIAEEMGWKWYHFHTGNRRLGYYEFRKDVPNEYHIHGQTVEKKTPPPSVFEKGNYSIFAPDFPGDIAAARALPLETNDEKRRFSLALAEILIPDPNIGTAAIVYEAAFVTARQHSEAWLTMRRNDGIP